VDTKANPCQPLIKWVGGKRSLLPEVLPRIEKSNFSGRYFEPFIGGGAVFLALSPKNASISDFNSSLIHFYKVVRDDKELLPKLLRESKSYEKLIDCEKELYFYKTRDRFNKRNFDFRHAADFYILNKIGFNGLYRENASGMFNTPFGHRKTLPIPDIENWDRVRKLLRVASPKHQSFEMACGRAKKGDFVYFDPPYIPLTQTAAFTSYSAEGFGIVKQELLAEVCRDLTRKKVKFLLSNSDTRLTREMFGEFIHTEISAQRLVSASIKGRKPVGELLISNFKQ
jgi:DNA adenine methylase